MSDKPSSDRGMPLLPEEYRPAQRSDYVMLAVSLLLAGLFTAPAVWSTWKTVTKGEVPMVEVLILAFFWLIPLLRTLLNWRAAVRAGVIDHSALVRVLWQTQLLPLGIIIALLAIPAFALSGRYVLF